MAYANSETIKQSPIDFVYIFVTQDYLNAIAKAFSSAHAATIKSKYVNAKRYISGWGKDNNMTFEQAKAEVRSMIIEQYGKTPGEILIAWANGETVQGKNYSSVSGLYGIGETTGQTTFVQNPGASVNPTTGQISFGENTPEALWKTYQNINGETKTVGFNYTLGGNVYTSRYNPSTGQFVANTYGSAQGMQYANGSTYKASGASSAWENLNTALPIIKDFMSWLAQLVPDVVGKFVPLTTANTVPAQTDYTVTDNKVGVASFGVVGVLLIGGLLLGSKSRKKQG